MTFCRPSSAGSMPYRGINSLEPGNLLNPPTFYPPHILFCTIRHSHSYVSQSPEYEKNQPAAPVTFGWKKLPTAVFTCLVSREKVRCPFRFVWVGASELPTIPRSKHFWRKVTFWPQIFSAVFQFQLVMISDCVGAKAPSSSPIRWNNLSSQKIFPMDVDTSFSTRLSVQQVPSNKTNYTQKQSSCTPCYPPHYKYWTIRNRRKRTLEKEGRNNER